MKKLFIYAVFLAIAIISTTIFVSCNKDPDFSTTPLAVTGAEIRHATIDTIAVGDVLPLRGNTVPNNATNQGVTWSSSVPEVAAVNNEGVVTALTAGTTIITITTAQGNFTDTCRILVIPAAIPVTGVVLNEDLLELTIGTTGTTGQLTAIIAPTGATIQSATWKSSDETVATVNETGLVTARGVGAATITVTTTNGGFMAECEVIVLPVAVTEVRWSLATMSTMSLEDVGSTGSLTVVVNPTSAFNRTVVWVSSNPDVATVTQSSTNPLNATVTAVEDGQAIITVINVSSGLATSCVVTVGVVIEPCTSITAATIVSYVQDPSINSVATFLNGGAATTYDITEMSPRLDAWRTAYAAAIPEFDKFMLVMPSVATSTSSGELRSLAFRITYTSTENVWNFVTVNPEPGTIPSVLGPIVVPMADAGNNPNSDATFNELFRVDRTTGYPGGATPHSTTPPFFGQAADSPALDAVLGIFTSSGPSDGSSSASHTNPVNIAAPDNNLIGFLNSPTGFSIFQDPCDPNMFWFRSKANPTDWFVVVRQ